MFFSFCAYVRAFIKKLFIFVDCADPLTWHRLTGFISTAELRATCRSVGKNVIVGKVTIWAQRKGDSGFVILEDNVRLYDGCRLVVDNVSPNSGITIRKGSSLNFNCYVEGSGGVTIEEGAKIGPNVSILSSSHSTTPGQAENKKHSPVHIKKNVWIGANVVIMHGITIGENAIVGAGSIVTKDVPDADKVAGVPARSILKRETEKT